MVTGPAPALARSWPATTLAGPSPDAGRPTSDGARHHRPEVYVGLPGGHGGQALFRGTGRVVEEGEITGLVFTPVARNSL